VFDAERVVSLSRIERLQGMSPQPDGGLRIGALTTLAEIASDPTLRTAYPALARAAGEAASPQLRNQGTLGGNLCQKPRCWYYRGDFHCLRKGGPQCFALAGENTFHAIFGSDNKCCIVHPSDTAPALKAYGATLRIAGPDGVKEIEIEDFFVLPAEDPERETILDFNQIVLDIVLPAIPETGRSSYRKVRARRSWDFALAGVATCLNMDGAKIEHASIVLSGAAPIPWRAVEAEQFLTGKTITQETATGAAEAAVKNAQPLKGNEYKVALFREIIAEELLKLAVSK
jgi:xanthine dehydrogenase YagS FAD-binding subunit